MRLTRLDPFRELEALTGRLNRVLGQGLVPATTDDQSAFGDWAPAMDVEEADTEYVVSGDLPAIRKEDLKVDIQDGVLTVEGERRQEKEEKNKKFHRVERSFGKFVRRMAVPSDVDQAKVSAALNDGVLTIRLPKSEAARPRSVNVKIA